jgi:hypothetical protein
LSAVHDEVFLKLTPLFEGNQRTCTDFSFPVASCDAARNTGIILIWLLHICAACCEYDNEHSAPIQARIYPAADRTAACNKVLNCIESPSNVACIQSSAGTPTNMTETLAFPFYPPG